MKFLFLLALLIGIAMALESSMLEAPIDRKRPHKRTHRPKKGTGASAFRAANKPKDAPASYKTGTGRASRKRPTTALKKVPAELIDPDTKRRRDSLTTLRQLRGLAAANDFYECTNANPSPKSSDCGTIIDQVLASNDDLEVTANACLLFSFGTCQAFFCSLCTTLATTTDFIGNELDTLDALCLDNGQVGTIVGQDAPQWDVGFTYAGDSLPTYDVC
ncbi:hypothetical protein B0T19DRAFT_240376 [Cercophora scortea]|uniref:Uncharacterized protein n=1 Tax=Cercophora scortea TaxID=314031 RepID=A0AAE0M651_9PEZI|nr:hypothetical protein B0T19DRAFT_240376 [Cercophora scortea]